MKTVTCKLPDEMVDDLDSMVREEKYASRSEAIRDALRRLIQMDKGVEFPEQQL